jgi:heptosyltransferase-2
MLRKKGLKVVLLGDGSSDPVPNDCDLRGKTTFHKLAAIIKKSKVLVGGDSLPLHIAQAVGTPAVGLFGDTFSDKRLIPGLKAIGISASKEMVSCLGCHHRKEPPQVIGTCDRPSAYCMEYLSHEDVLKVVESILA